MNKVNLKLYPEVKYKDLVEVLKSMNFINQSNAKNLIYTHLSLDAKMILPLPKSMEDNINKAHLWGNLFVLQEKGVVTSIDAFYKIIENHKFYIKNVLV